MVSWSATPLATCWASSGVSAVAFTWITDVAVGLVTSSMSCRSETERFRPLSRMTGSRTYGVVATVA